MQFLGILVRQRFFNHKLLKECKREGVKVEQSVGVSCPSKF